MTLVLDLSDDALVRLEAAAEARGMSVEQLATETLSQIPAVDSDFAFLVSDTIAQHRDILDSLAET